MRLNKNLSISSFWLAVCIVAATTSATAFAQTDSAADEDAILTIGSKAPALDIETWFSDREGAFEQTTEFESGKIYLIDFWATWSTVSHPWMTKYADLQDRYFDDGVQVIRISDEDEDSVANFLELDVNGNAETIYAEWTIGYCVTTDPDRSVHEDYMVAAQQLNVPVVFIVGRTGLIEWIGNPAKMQKPLKEIVADQWDREAFGAKMLAAQKMKLQAVELRGLMQKGDTEAALKLIEKIMIDAPDAETRSEMAELRLEILLETDGPNIAEAFKEVADNLAGNSRKLNGKAWRIVTRQQGGKEIPADLLEVATATAKRGVELARKEGSDDQLGMVLDTHAHLVVLQGDLDRAIEIQIEASQFSQRDDIHEYLEELQKEKAIRALADAKTEEEAKEATSDVEDSDDSQSEGTEAEEASDVPAGIES